MAIQIPGDWRQTDVQNCGLQIDNLRDQLAKIAESLERGMAARPISNYLRSLKIQAQSEPISITKIVTSFASTDTEPGSLTSNMPADCLLSKVELSCIPDVDTINSLLLGSHLFWISPGVRISPSEHMDLLARHFLKCISPILLADNDQLPRQLTNREAIQVIGAELPNNPHFFNALRHFKRSQLMNEVAILVDDILRKETIHLFAQQFSWTRRSRLLESRTMELALRSATESVRSHVTAMSHGLRELLQTRIRPNSQLHRTKENIPQLSPLSVNDLTVERGNSNRDILHISPGANAKVRAEFQKSSREWLEASVDEVIREGAERDRQLFAQCELHGVDDITLKEPVFRASEVWTQLQPLLEFDVRFRAEIPVRHLGHRLMEGRKAVFTVLMFMSIFGGLLGISRQSLGIELLMVGLFLYGFAWTFVSWRKEKHEFLTRELERVNETLINESKRIWGDFQREAGRILNDSIEKRKTQLGQKLDEYLNRQISEISSRADRDRNEVRLVTRNIDQRQRELQEWVRSTAAIQRSSAELIDRARTLVISVWNSKGGQK